MEWTVFINCFDSFINCSKPFTVILAHFPLHKIHILQFGQFGIQYLAKDAWALTTDVLVSG